MVGIETDAVDLLGFVEEEGDFFGGRIPFVDCEGAKVGEEDVAVAVGGPAFSEAESCLEEARTAACFRNTRGVVGGFCGGIRGDGERGEC